jgi:hypothetical protein
MDSFIEDCIFVNQPIGNFILMQINLLDDRLYKDLLLLILLYNQILKRSLY